MKTVSVIVALVFGLVPMASGQVHGFGFVGGKIVDEKGAPLADVAFRATLPAMGSRFAGSSNQKGEWKIVGMAQGAWEISFERPGYATSRAKIVLENQLVRLPPITIKMKPAV